MNNRDKVLIEGIFGTTQIEIEKVKTLPKGANYFRLSFGYQIEREHVYKLDFHSEIYYIMLVKLLNVFVIQKLIYKQEVDKYIQIDRASIRS